MTVSTYLELWTFAMMWKVYSATHVLVFELGLYVLPIIVIMVQALWVRSEQGGGIQGTRAMLTTAWMGLISYGLAYLLCIAPLVRFDANSLRYKPLPSLRDPNPPEVNVNETGTTYDYLGYAVDQLPGNEIRLPVMFALSTAVANGLNLTARDLMPSNAIRLLDQQIRLLRIRHPMVRAEAQAFYDQCYAPAYSKLHTRFLSTALPGQSEVIIEELNDPSRMGAASDTGYIGSTLLLQTPGLYKPCSQPDQCGGSLQATQPVVGWPIDPTRDVDLGYARGVEQWGKPYCDQWWLGAGTVPGVRTKILNDLRGFNPEEYDALRSRAIDLNNLVATIWEDEVVRFAWDITPPDIGNSDIAYQNSAGTGNGVGSKLWRAGAHAFKSTATFLGNIGQSIETSVVQYAAIQLAPKIQALIQFLMLAFAPILFVLTAANWPVLITFCGILFSVQTWPLMTQLTLWIDQYLFTAMYQGQGALATFFNGQSNERMQLDIATTVCIGLAPVLWTTVWTLVGLREAARISSAVGEMARGVATDRAFSKAATIVRAAKVGWSWGKGG